MKAKQRKRALWISIAGMLVVGAAVVSFLVMASGSDITFTATAYSDAIRFAANRVASIQVRIYDMSENELWDSGQISTDYVDWDRTNEWGERLANGYYIYFVQGWSAADEIVLAKTGKVVLLPGDQVQLQSAPVASGSPQDAEWRDEPVFSPMAHIISDDMVVRGRISSIEDGGADNFLTLRSGTGAGGDRAGLRFYGYDPANSGDYCYFQFRSDYNDVNLSVKDVSADKFHSAFNFYYLDDRFDFKDNQVENVKRLGIGCSDTAVTALLTVQGTSGDLIAAYNSTDRVFVVESDGTVRADGAFYSGAGDCSTGGFNAGGADVAERINTSEWLEAGDVVEIDPEHPGFFRKAKDPYSRRVAGIISTSPGVILGNSSDPVSEEWEDSRPVLAIAGRVPCKVSTENGPIQIGDLLVSSSISGVAMKGDSEKAIGAVVGKAMEPLENGEGTIMVQVMLR